MAPQKQGFIPTRGKLKYFIKITDMMHTQSLISLKGITELICRSFFEVPPKQGASELSVEFHTQLEATTSFVPAWPIIYSGADCEAICQAPLPSRPIERGRAGAGLLAHVVVSKYADHLPLYRQSQIYAREGIDIDRSTMADWVERSTALLEPLAKAIGRQARKGQAKPTFDEL